VQRAGSGGAVVQVKKTARDRYLWRKYGLTEFMWLIRLRQQQNKCALCGEPFGTRRPNVDHRHEKGYSKFTPARKRQNVRGLVCGFPCNKYHIARNDLKSARQVVQYLERYELLRQQNCVKV